MYLPNINYKIDCMKNYLLPLCLFTAAVCMTFSDATAQSPVINAIVPNSTSIEKFEKFEATVSLTAGFINAYDYDDILVRGIFTAPSGKKDTIEGFYMQGFTLNTTSGNLTPTGTNNFVVRYAPSETGSYNFVVTCLNTAGYTESSTNNFQSVSSAKKGFVRKSTGNYLKFDNNTQYIPVGQNLAWQQNNKYLDYRNWTDKMAANNANFIRLWQCSWGLGIEWRGAPYEGLKKYRQDNAFYTDKLLDECNAKDIYMMLCINHHGMVSSTVNPNWPESPYNAVNGGPCTNTWDYFTNTTAKNLHKNRLRYIIARWGYSRNVMSWELFNEVEWTDNFNTYKTQIKDWHQEMARYIQAKDPFDHLVTTSFAHDNNDAATWNLPEMDFTQTHYYNGSANMEMVLADGAKSYLTQFNKPTFNGEFGVETNNISLSTVDPNGIYIHNSLWATLFSGAMGTGASWWWDSYIEPQNLYYHYKGPGLVSAKIPFVTNNYKVHSANVTGGGNADLTFSPGADWGAVTPTSFTVNADGTMTPGASQLNKYLYGSQWNTQNRYPPTFTVTFSAASQFKVTTGGSIGTSPRISVYVDGTLVLDQAATVNTTFTVPVASGTHTIKVDNLGTDWTQIAGYTFTNLGAPLNTYILKSANSLQASGWIHNKKYNWIDVKNTGAPAAVNGASLTVPGMANGTYQVKWFDCLTGAEQSVSNIVATNNQLVLPAPSISWDAAFTAFELTTLPITLSAFRGEAQQNRNVLFINIAQSENVQEVLIERSNDSRQFNSIGKLSPVGNKFIGNHLFADNSPTESKNFYRLKVIDKDGAFNYSGVVLLQRKTIGMQLFPNPVKGELFVKANDLTTKKCQVAITDNAGRQLLSKVVVPLNDGFNITLPVQALNKGVYFCSVTDDAGTVLHVEKFIKE